MLSLERCETSGADALPSLSGWQPKLLLQTSSEPYSVECQIEAREDIAAVRCWLRKYRNHKTRVAYQREAERLLLWCAYERGLTLGQLKAQDWEAYLTFLKAPPSAWCATRAHLRAGKGSPFWRPFVAGLEGSAFKMAVRIIHSLLNYLVEAHYLRANVLKLIDTASERSLDTQARQYAVWERMLEDDEWDAVQTVLEHLPEGSRFDVETKRGIQLLFAMLYFLGLRIEEAASALWNAFRYREGQWWFFVRGKGGKLADIPVHEKLLRFMKVYRLQQGKVPLPNSDEADAVFVSAWTQKPVSARQLSNWVKAIGREASQRFIDEPLKQEKLKKFSPHWLRHLFASHLDRAGVSATILRDLMRHGSLQTTQLYQHAGHRLRQEAVQKVNLSVTPCPVREFIKPDPEVEIQVVFTGRPVSLTVSLRSLISVMETHLLKGYRWEWRGAPPEIFLENAERTMRLFNRVEIRYRLEKISLTELKAMTQAIEQESHYRLLKAQITHSPAS